MFEWFMTRKKARKVNKLASFLLNSLFFMFNICNSLLCHVFNHSFLCFPLEIKNMGLNICVLFSDLVVCLVFLRIKAPTPINV